MSNRLVDLESTIVRCHKKKSTAHRNGGGPILSRKPQGALKRIAKMPPPPPPPTLSGAPVAATGLSALVKRWPARAASKVHAFGAVDYTIPGTFGPLAQPDSLACWATVFTMLMSWRRQQSLSTETALGMVGQKWVDCYRNNTGLLGPDKPEFLTAAGLVAEPPRSYSVEGWEQLLRNYGPIWVTTEEVINKAWAIHARIIIGISGDGTPERTFFTIVDPLGGRTYQESIEVFVPKYEAEVIKTGYMRVQVVHWSADARAEVRAQSFGGRTSFPARRTRTRALAAPAVAIASPIIGAVLTRILGNEDDITWELDQLQGLKHPDNNPSAAGSAPFQNKTFRIDGPRAWTTIARDHIGVDTEITFQHNGHSLGNIQVSIVNANDAVFADLQVKETINDDANTYSRAPSTARFAAIKVRIHYYFTFTARSSYIWIDDITLYGDGTYAFSRRETQ